MGLGSSAPTTSLSGTALEAATTEARVAARELLKDLAGKALRARPDMTLPQKVERQLRILDGLARGVIDPAVANRQLITETGTTLAKTMDTAWRPGRGDPEAQLIVARMVVTGGTAGGSHRRRAMAYLSQRRPFA